MTAKILEPPSDSQALIRTAAFQLLLKRAKPIEPDVLVQATGIKRHRLVDLLEELDRVGRIRRDEAGRVVGSAGLSVTLDRHEIELAGRRFWTWCAYDILGIFGALEASGRASSPSPDGSTIHVDFERGRPLKSGAALFRPDDELMDCCSNVYEEWCPNSNLFASAEVAAAWAEQRNIRGRVLDLDEASGVATQDWANVINKGS